MTDQYKRTCGRPTRSGSPCKIRISGSDVACGTHATEQHKAVAEADLLPGETCLSSHRCLHDTGGGFGQGSRAPRSVLHLFGVLA